MKGSSAAKPTSKSTDGKVRMVGIHGDAEARREPQVLALESETDGSDGARNALGEHAQHLVRNIRNQDAELIAPETAEKLVATHLSRHFAGDADEHRIACAVPEGVVDVLEVVEIEEKQREP